MHALGHREINVRAQVRRNLLLVSCVRCVNARVFVILAKDSHASKAREWIAAARRDSWRHRKRIWPSRAAAKGRNRKDRALLHAVRCDGTYLRKHVLTPVENAIARAERGLVIIKYVPGQTDSRLEL